MIKAIIFDWHGVLDTVKFEDLVKQLASFSGKSVEESKEILVQLNTPYILGKETEDTFWDDVKKSFQIDDNQVRYLKDFVNTVNINHRLWDMLPDASRKYTLAILSDCPQEKIRAIRSQADLSLFSVIFFSAEKHLTKNNDDFFLQLLEELKLGASYCLFVDDSEKHVQTAKRLGFQACHFTDVSDLLPFISQLG